MTKYEINQKRIKDMYYKKRERDFKTIDRMSRSMVEKKASLREYDLRHSLRNFSLEEMGEY